MRRVLWLLLLIVLSASGYGQVSHSIQGKVLNAGTQDPLGGATVFLAATSKGTISAADGSFELPGVDSGSYRLVVSFIGFETFTKEIDVTGKLFIDIALKPAYRILDEVTIESNRDQRGWHDNYAIFKKHFLGMSDNADKCVIKNPKALKFSSNGGILTARTDEALTIENVGLGYTVTFLLESFAFNSVADKVMYKGEVVFNSLQPKNERQRRLWASNRLKAYEGSQLHFMRALYRRQLMEEGFYFNVFENKYSDSTVTSTAIADSELKVKSKLFKDKIRMSFCTNYYRILDSLRSTSARPLLAFRGRVEVTYIHEAESYNYLHTHYPGKAGITRPQKSSLVLLQQDIPVQSNGMVLNEQHLQAQGYWGWELVAESLPSDYDPEADRKLLSNGRRN